MLSCWARVIVHGTLPGFGHSARMTSYLKAHGIRIFDYTKFAEPLREQIRSNAERLAEENGLEIQFLRKSNIGKEALVDKLLAERGDQPGLVCILSAMVACQSRHLDLQHHLPRLTWSQISRHLKRLRVHGLLKRMGRRYKYYVTELVRPQILSIVEGYGRQTTAQPLGTGRPARVARNATHRMRQGGVISEQRA